MTATVDRAHRPARHQRRRSSRHARRRATRGSSSTASASTRSARGRGAGADRRIDAGGRACIPGFVDSHTHLVFAGDRSDEFAARMAGEPYAAGGIRDTTAATRGARPTTSCARWHARAPARGAPRGHHHDRDQVRLRARRRRRGARCCGSPRELTDETTFLGAHVVPAEYDGRGRRLRRPRVRRDARRRARRTRAGSTPSASAGAFDADQCRAVLEAGRAARARPAAPRQPARPRPGRAARRRARLRVGRPLHLPHRRRRRRAGRERHGGDAAAGHRLLDPPALPRRPPAARRRRAVALATNCNPGSSYTTSMAFCIALAVRDMRMTVDEAVQAATAGRRAARCAATTSAGSAPAPAPTSWCSTRRPTPTSSTAPACRSWR